jgi:hypothetical protein
MIWADAAVSRFAFDAQLEASETRPRQLSRRCVAVGRGNETRGNQVEIQNRQRQRDHFLPTDEFHGFEFAPESKP